MAILDIFPAKINSPPTTLTYAIGDADTTIYVDELGDLPDAPNEATLGEDGADDAETVKYTSKSASSGAGYISGITRGFEGTAKAWGAGTKISRKFTAYDYDAVCNNLTEHNHKLDDLTAPDDNTDLDVSTSAHGLCPKLSNDSTEFLDGTGAWATPDTYTEIFEEDTGTLTLPSSPTVGQVYEIVGTGTAWTVNIPASTYVRLLDVIVDTTVAGTTGYECAAFIYAGTIDSLATWIIKSVVGELTLT